MVKRFLPEMSALPSCAIVIITPPGEVTPEAAAMESVIAADDGRVFGSVMQIVSCSESFPSAWRKGVSEALATGAEWIFFLDVAETLHPQAFHMLAPALANYDVVWGGLEINAGEQFEAPRITKFAARTLPEFYHMALSWWVGGSHLIRAQTASRIAIEVADETFWRAEYFSRLWRGSRCLKTAQPLTRARRLPEISDTDKAFLIEDLARQPCFMEVSCSGEILKLPYTGCNPALEREQLRGMFYEQADLLELKPIVPEGAVIADIGANTGNHTLFFAKVLKAGTVIPVEPNPDAIRHLKCMIAENSLENVDPSRLGIAVGARPGQAQVTTGRRGYLGTARMRITDDGPVPVRPLDELITETIDVLKIDVEDMEIDVLKGAKGLIRRDKPILMVEVQDENLLPILDITRRLGYTVRKIFADFGYANYLLMPGAAEDLI